MKYRKEVSFVCAKLPLVPCNLKSFHECAITRALLEMCMHVESTSSVGEGGQLWVLSCLLLGVLFVTDKVTSEGSVESNLIWEDVCYCYPQFLELGVCCLSIVLNCFISPSKYILRSCLVPGF